MAWKVESLIVGWAVIFPKVFDQYVSFRPDQYGRVRMISYGSGGVANKSLFDEVRQQAHAAHMATDIFRYGSSHSEPRRALCEDIAKRLNKAGVSLDAPLKRI